MQVTGRINFHQCLRSQNDKNDLCLLAFRAKTSSFNTYCLVVVTILQKI
jgi:hypothetical protein